MLKPRGQTGLEAKNLASASSFWPRAPSLGLKHMASFNISALEPSAKTLCRSNGLAQEKKGTDCVYECMHDV